MGVRSCGSAVDLGDLDFGVLLAVAALDAHVLAALEAEGDQLGALLEPEHLGAHACAGDRRLADLDRTLVADEQHLAERDLLPGLVGALQVEAQDVALADGRLVAWVVDDGVHGSSPGLPRWNPSRGGPARRRRGARRGRWAGRRGEECSGRPGGQGRGSYLGLGGAGTAGAASPRVSSGWRGGTATSPILSGAATLPMNTSGAVTPPIGAGAVTGCAAGGPGGAGAGAWPPWQAASNAAPAVTTQRARRTTRSSRKTGAPLGSHSMRMHRRPCAPATSASASRCVRAAELCTCSAHSEQKRLRSSPCRSSQSFGQGVRISIGCVMRERRPRAATSWPQPAIRSG